MSNSSLASFDLSFFNVDLNRVASQIVDPENPRESAVRDFIKWLAHERISEQNYEYCIAQTAAIAYPNEEGLESKNRIFR